MDGIYPMKKDEVTTVDGVPQPVIVWRKKWTTFMNTKLH